MKVRTLDIGYGAAELLADDPLVRQAQQLGWEVYREGFNGDELAVVRLADGAGFTASGSKSAILVIVYDPERWEIQRWEDSPLAL